MGANIKLQPATLEEQVNKEQYQQLPGKLIYLSHTRPDVAFAISGAMATMKDLPCELLFHIIFLLVQSSGGAEAFARIIAVCRDFLLCAEAKSVLRVVKFDIKMEPFKFYQFQNVKGLLVKCSEAGNEAAQHVLGKVILLSSAHLFLSERQQVSSSVRPSDRSMLNRWIVDTNVPAQNNKVSSFMTYFTPIQVCTSELSTTRLVHYQLVKLFLLNGSHHDFIEMGVFLKYCIKYFMGVYQRKQPAHCLYRVTWESRNLDGNLEDHSSARSGNSSGMGAETIFLLKEYIVKCARGGVDWHEALNDMNFVEALREDISNRLNEAYADFSMTRAETLGKFERKFG
ncbi:uncharacterized protein LOC141718323 [Apium graveolens]|uniref:uncharacterized protein LOC141718323 n=1 Tax=Apium graveolens TaxID=4045 RepID=UPI003D7B851C